MSLTEAEIFDCMRTNLRSAANDCDVIASQPIGGPIFDRMRKSLKLVEGACRQAAYFRQDARWLGPGLKMEQAHQIARMWLHRPSVQSHKLFTKLAGALRQWMIDIEKLETAHTGRVGLILPRPIAPPHRDTKPVSVLEHMPSTKLVLPPGYGDSAAVH